MNGVTAAPIWVLGEGLEAERHTAAWQSLGARVTLRRLPVTLGPADLAGETQRLPLAASVCLPPAQRIEQSRALLAAGVHVLCAAPLSGPGEALGALVASVHGSGRHFVPAHPLLYSPGMSHLMAHVRARRLGSVQNVFSYRYGPVSARLLYEPTRFELDWELASQAALVKTLCLRPEARVSDLLLRAQGDELWLGARLYYDDDILATVRCDPELRPPRRGVMVTFTEAVLRWELSDDAESLSILRGPHHRSIPTDGPPPYEAMVERFLRTAQGAAPPYEDETAALRALALESRWRESNEDHHG